MHKTLQLIRIKVPYVELFYFNFFSTRSSAQSFYIEPPQWSRSVQNRCTQNCRTQSRRAEPPYAKLRAELCAELRAELRVELRAERRAVPPQSFVQSLRTQGFCTWSLCIV